MTGGMVHEAAKGGTVEWYTPAWLFQLLATPFDLDVASPGAEVVPWIPAARHLTAADNALAMPWHGRVWMNHPFGIQDISWVDRFLLHRNGIGICHARTDNAWCKRLLKSCDLVVFTKRIQFVDASGNPPLRLNKKTGKWEKSSPGSGQMLFACGDQNASALWHAAGDPRLAGVAMSFHAPPAALHGLAPWPSQQQITMP